MLTPQYEITLSELEQQQRQALYEPGQRPNRSSCAPRSSYGPRLGIMHEPIGVAVVRIIEGQALFQKVSGRSALTAKERHRPQCAVHPQEQKRIVDALG
jgi:hypothetical protein